MTQICDGCHMRFYLPLSKRAGWRRPCRTRKVRYRGENSYSCSMKAPARSLRAACTTVVGWTWSQEHLAFTVQLARTAAPPAAWRRPEPTRGCRRWQGAPGVEGPADCRWRCCGKRMASTRSRRRNRRVRCRSGRKFCLLAHLSRQTACRSPEQITTMPVGQTGEIQQQLVVVGGTWLAASTTWTAGPEGSGPDRQVEQQICLAPFHPMRFGRVADGVALAWHPARCSSHRPGSRWHRPEDHGSSGLKLSFSETGSPS